MCIDNGEVAGKINLEVGIKACRMNREERDLVFFAVLLDKCEILSFDGEGVYDQGVFLFASEEFLDAIALERESQLLILFLWSQMIPSALETNRL